MTETKKAMSAARKKRQRNRILLTVLVVLIFIGALAGAISLLTKNTHMDLTLSYLETKGESHTYKKATQMKAKSFASDLCVASGSTEDSSITLKGEEKAALFDVNNKRVLYAEGIYTKVYPASITKIMTGIMAVKYGNMDDVVTITEEDVNLEEGSQMVGLEAGDTITMDELFHGLLVYSGNDCAMAIARHISGSVSAFVDQMNVEVKKLGATGTHFKSPHGLHDEDHYTTVYDIYLMLNEALNYSYFVETMQLSYYMISYDRGGETISSRLDATDHYLTHEVSAPKDVTVLGGKTGTTQAAGSCLAISSQNRYGEPFISIVMKAVNKETLYEDMNALLEKINS